MNIYLLGFHVRSFLPEKADHVGGGGVVEEGVVEGGVPHTITYIHIGLYIKQ